MSRQQELARHERQLGETREIVGAMKAMAFMEVRRLAQSLDSQRRVVETMNTAAADLLSYFPDALPSPVGELRHVYLLIGSERGFCGSFNESLVERLEECLAREPVRSDAWPGIIGWGRRLCARLEGHPRFVAALDGAALADEVNSRLQQLLVRLAELQGASATALTVLYRDPQRKAVVEDELLPPFQGLRNRVQRYPCPPQLNLSPATLVRELAEEYLLQSLQKIIYLSLMAENQQRMQHLEGASHYLDEKLDLLHRKASQLRQEEITEEIEVILLNADSASMPRDQESLQGDNERDKGDANR
ncbi:F0F1 ATP synthase subunit gamma [Microbulbifer zhoushanensis]|uniref:F0F1 ATP synthase subunit gamma n=1 Tax=Microbulbifer zhoushanensis TaxID=2904254 RepID=UPI001F01AD81|nr:F0F1 ATP synthase subunit gamma [Microbulbifer zhoushanensis]